MAKYLLMGDIHLSDRAPSSCTDTYNDDLFAILENTVEIATQHQVEAVIWAGDVFHHKTPSRTTHATVMRLIDLAQTYPCRVYVVPGNHDLLNDRFGSLAETQPLGVVISSGAVDMLDGWMFDLDKLNETGWLDPVFGVPWLGRFDDTAVFGALANFRGDPTENPHHLVVTHAPLYPLGLELPYENYPADKWAAAMGSAGSVYYGHVHEAHGVHQAGGVTFCNPGAISRGSLHEHNLKREVSVAIWDSETGKFTIVPVSHKPADEVFRLVEVGEAKAAQVELDSFLNSIGQTRIEITSIEAVMAHIRSLQLGTELETLVEKLLTGAAK